MNSAKTSESVHPALKQEETRPEEITGLVLSLQDYKENDGILKVATPDQIVSFYARGVLKSTSKNRRLCNPFSKVRLIYEPKYSRDLLFLIHGSVDWYDAGIHENLLAQSICFVLRDLIVRIGINPMIYHCLEMCWHCFEDKDEEGAYLYASLVLANLLKLAGVAPNVDSCVVCGNRAGIETLELEEGGFVCRNCRKPEWPKMEKASLQAWRALFRAREENIPYLQEHFIYTPEHILQLGSFYMWHSQTKVASVPFLKSVIAMVQPKAQNSGSMKA